MEPQGPKDPGHLSTNFWTIPATASQTMTTRQLRETLLYHDGFVMAQGRIWDITSKNLGAGVYRVTLKARK